MDAGEIAYLRKVVKDATRPAEWRPINGGIVVPVVGEFDPRGRRRGSGDAFSEEQYYGGDLICESMSTRDAIAASAAVVALPQALDEIERLRGAGRLQLSRWAS
jgi:hypothetical protein